MAGKKKQTISYYFKLTVSRKQTHALDKKNTCTSSSSYKINDNICVGCLL